MKPLIIASISAVAGFVFLSSCASQLVADPPPPYTAHIAENAYEEMSEAPLRGVATAENADESASHYAAWGSVAEATGGATNIIGTYAAGCISGAQALPLKSQNYIVVHPSKHAYYGDPSMIKYLTGLAERAHGAGLSPLMIEDISHPRGGPVPKGHGSHQIGLDADVSLTMATHPYSAEELESFEGPSYVTDRKFLKPSWSESQVKLVALAADSEKVNRIFVSPAIKKYFCTRFASAPWLYKLRPWWEHEDHMHIRLNCPPGASSCRPQAALNPKVDACGKELEWWLSPSTDEEWAKIAASTWKRPFPKLPAECENVRTR